MPRPPAQTNPEAVDDLAALLLTSRAIDATHAADRALYTTGIRAAARAIDAGQRRAVARALTDRGIPASEGLLRRWASQPALADAPTWWEVIDHRDQDALQTILQRVLGMSVDVDHAPCVSVPVTAAQVEALRAALPDAVIGPLGEDA